MKLGSFEGSTDEFKDIVENHGFTADNFLASPRKFKPKIWPVYLLTFFLTVLFCILYTCNIPEGWSKLLTMLSFVLLIFFSVIIHLKFDNWVVTSIVFLGGILLFSISLGFLTPKEALDQLKEKVNSKI